MRIGVWISEPQSDLGGGASYENHLIELIDRYEFTGDFDVVFLTKETIKSKQLKKPVFKLEYIEPNLKEKFYTILCRAIPFSKKFKRFKRKEGKIRFDLSLAKYLKDKEVDIIFYPSEHKRNYLSNTPFIATNWDIGHLTTYQFPEYLETKTRHFRNKWYEKEIKDALLVIAESIAGRDELLKYTNVGENKIHIVPLIPGACIYKKDNPSLLEDYSLTKNKFYFYPSQFWAHKNHIILLDAFRKVLKTKPDMKLVLSGSDKGQLNYVIKYSKRLGVFNQVLFTGFISEETIVTFYQHATALVMPTYLGPTNIPLLEARLLGCPVLCSDFDGHHEMMGEGAIYFQPYDADDIASAMIKIQDSDFSNELLQKAKTELEHSIFNIEKSIQCLDDAFSKACSIRKCWSTDF